MTAKEVYFGVDCKTLSPTINSLSTRSVALLRSILNLDDLHYMIDIV
jgi:hypothetical protein